MRSTSKWNDIVIDSDRPNYEQEHEHMFFIALQAQIESICEDALWNQIQTLGYAGKPCVWIVLLLAETLPDRAAKAREELISAVVDEARNRIRESVPSEHIERYQSWLRRDKLPIS